MIRSSKFFIVGGGFVLNGPVAETLSNLPYIVIWGAEFLSWLTKYLARFCTLWAAINALNFSELFRSLGALMAVASEQATLNEFAHAIDSNRRR